MSDLKHIYVAELVTDQDGDEILFSAPTERLLKCQIEEWKKDHPSKRTSYNEYWCNIEIHKIPFYGEMIDSKIPHCFVCGKSNIITEETMLNEPWYSNGKRSIMCHDCYSSFNKDWLEDW